MPFQGGVSLSKALHAGAATLPPAGADPLIIAWLVGSMAHGLATLWLTGDDLAPRLPPGYLRPVSR